MAGAGAGFRGELLPFLRGTCQSSVKSGGFMGRLKHCLLARTSRATSRCGLRDAQVPTENSLDILKQPFNPDICADNTKPLSFGTSSWFLEEVPGRAKAPLANLLEAFSAWAPKRCRGHQGAPAPDLTMTYALCAPVRFVSELLSGRVFLRTGDRLEYFARLNSHVDIHLLLLSLSEEVQQNRRLVLTRTARC